MKNAKIARTECVYVEVRNGKENNARMGLLYDGSTIDETLTELVDTFWPGQMADLIDKGQLVVNWGTCIVKKSKGVAEISDIRFDNEDNIVVSRDEMGTIE